MLAKSCSILIVEDEKSLREVLALNLKMDGFDVVSVENGRDATEYIKQNNVDLILMDVMLPEMNGIDASKIIKQKRPDLPIIILSALDQSVDRIKGLKAGADDYINKPFNYDELLIRIQKQIARNKKSLLEELIVIGSNKIDFAKNCINNKSGTHQLNPKESLLLKYLIENANRTISRQELMAKVWEYDSFPNSRTVDNYISALRKYLTKDDLNQEYIRSERGIGYRLIL
jgi:two-component system alkaline phosphatase synthesis response regulator PhoP